MTTDNVYNLTDGALVKTKQTVDDAALTLKKSRQKLLKTLRELAVEYRAYMDKNQDSLLIGALKDYVKDTSFIVMTLLRPCVTTGIGFEKMSLGVTFNNSAYNVNSVPTVTANLIPINDFRRMRGQEIVKHSIQVTDMDSFAENLRTRFTAPLPGIETSTYCDELDQLVGTFFSTMVAACQEGDGIDVRFNNGNNNSTTVFAFNRTFVVELTYHRQNAIDALHTLLTTFDEAL